MRKPFFLLIFFAAWSFSQVPPSRIQFVITSDSHYGITRPMFRGDINVAASIVNAALVAQLNHITTAHFPADGGLRAEQAVGPIDFVADTGDIANREELAGKIQSADLSWSQFRRDYIENLKLTGPDGKKTALYVVPGNHDVSNAIGYYKPLFPAIDKTSMVEIFNLMLAPAVRKTAATYEYPRDRIMVSHDLAGVHFVYLTIWPDGNTREWLEDDLRKVRSDTPVVLFTHDPPDGDSKHFKNPNGKHDINPTDQFENLLGDTFADLKSEEMALENFFHRHPNIRAYFHGHNNWNEYYDWTGPNHTVRIHTFRVDSPMKGKYSAMDETKLSFQAAVIDPAARTLTVREVLWNAHPERSDQQLVWGASTTVSLKN